LVFERTNWALGRHEQWAIVGTNGSGKSVLADGLRGHLPLIHGDLLYHFRPPEGLSAEEAIGQVAFEDRKSELHGTVVQSRWTSFEEEASLRVLDFLAYDRVMEVNPFEVSSRHAKMRPGFERRLRHLVRLLQIEGFLSRTLLSLSNGERQRVQLARALARPQRLLVLDEPYVGLDAAAREHFHRVLECLLKTPLRILLLTTRVGDLPQHTTHLLYLKDCQAVAAGPRRDVLDLLPRRLGLMRNSRFRASLQNLKAGKRRVPFRSQNPINLIELRNIKVTYGTNVIFQNFDWVVREGESWALLGPNGSGKTTLLSLINGDHPQSYVNEVIVFGQRRGAGESIWQLKKRIGWVSPELQLHFDGRVSVLDVARSGFHDTIGLFADPKPSETAVARRWLNHLGLTEFANSPLFSLSAGLQRMALLGRALVKSPRLLILDEPCQGLDPAHRELIVRSVDGLVRKRAVTAIFVTHRPEEIPPSIRRVLRLSKGPAPARFI
jgi:molybdate transport system ATP-binding protein